MRRKQDNRQLKAEAGLFVGQFAAPLIVFAIAAATGLGPVIAIIGVCGLIAAVAGAIVGRIRPEAAMNAD